MIARYFEPYLLLIAALFALAAGLTMLWDWGWFVTAWLALSAVGSVFLSWHYAHAPLVED